MRIEMHTEGSNGTQAHFILLQTRRNLIGNDLTVTVCTIGQIDFFFLKYPRLLERPLT